MGADPQLFRIDPQNHQSEAIKEVDFGQLGFQERKHIQEWVAANPDILGENLLIVGKEFSEFDRTNERLDLLAVDEDGRLVVIELKRDDTGTNVHWQAIKYASYMRRIDAERIIGTLANHAEVSSQDAEAMLLQHIKSDDLNGLNHDQRIIIVSHRFAPEVTSAVLWLNEKASVEDLMTCVQLTPYKDQESDSLYLQSNRIIPVPGAERYTIGVDTVQGEGDVGVARPGRRRTWSQARRERENDDVTRFFRRVEGLAKAELEEVVRPDRRSRHAGSGWGKVYGAHRYYHLWYKRQPWSNWDLSYHVELFENDTSGPVSEASSLKVRWRRIAREKWGWQPGPNEEATPNTSPWEAKVNFSCGAELVEALLPRLSGLHVYDDQIIPHGSWGCKIEVVRGGEALDETFANVLSDTLKRFISVITPVVDNIEETDNEEDA